MKLSRLLAALAFLSFLLLTQAAWALGPHGPYFENPDACAACHVAHAAYSVPLVRLLSQTQMCLVCHDGTGSIYNVYNAVYGFGPLSGSTCFHPVANTGNPAVGSVVECAYCHNPHGSTPKLLWNLWDKTTLATGVYGPDFCLICHGGADRNFTGSADTYWEDALGDHANGFAAHYDTTEVALLPSSGTEVTCVRCHQKHSSPGGGLLAPLIGASLCCSCHADPANSISGRNIQAEFGRASSHDVSGTAGMGCTSCHGPHTVGKARLSEWSVATSTYVSVTTNIYSDVSDPANTKSVFAGIYTVQDNGIGNVIGTVTDFCLRCHGATSPVATASTAVYVPSTVAFPSTPFTTNNQGWRKTFTGSAHGGKSLLCNECHQEHGSDYSRLQRYPEDTDLVDGECLRCHKAGGYSTAPDVKADFLSAYRHPTLTVSGVHSDTESYTGAARHAECTDCHDTHQATSGDSLRGVSGVVPEYGATAWSIPDSYAFTNGATYEYEVCLKCHSYFSYVSTPPISPSGGFAETDQSVEFNPNNAGYHAVIGSSKVPQFTDSGGASHYYGSYVSPWQGNSVLVCSDCHLENRRGPHGSDYAFILKNPPYALCTGCHSGDFYATYAQTPAGNPATDGSDSLRSGWSNPNLTVEEATYTYNGITATASVYNFHPVHANLGCRSCHSAVPHGWDNKRSLLVTAGDAYPYNSSARLWSAFALPASREQWYCTSCHS